jgi:hypothetical protein
MIKKRRPATSGQEREALIKMAADESELSRRTGNYKEQSTAGASARAKKYIEPVVETTLNVTSLGGLVTGAAKMIPTIIKGAVKLLTPRNAAKALKEGKATLAPEATTAQREAVKKLQKEAAKKRMEQAGYPKTDAAKTRDAAKAGKTPVGKPAGKPAGKPVDNTVSPAAATAAGAVATIPFFVTGKRGNVKDTSPREGESGSASNPIYVGPPPTATALKNKNEPKDNKVTEKKSESSFDSEPDPREDPSAWRKWNFKRVKAAEKAGVKPESIAKSSMDKEISERNMYDVSDKKGGRIKTSPKVKRAVGGMVKPKKKTSSPRGAGCAERGYGKAMMGGGKVKAYKAGGKVGGNRLY